MNSLEVVELSLIFMNKIKKDNFDSKTLYFECHYYFVHMHCKDSIDSG